MSARRTVPKVVLAMGLAGLATAAALTAYGEALPFLRQATTPTQNFMGLVAGFDGPASSELSKAGVLDDCFNAAHSFYAMAQPPARKRELHERCQEIALDIVAQVPTHSYAWYTAAASAIALGDAAAFNARLIRSQQTAPASVRIGGLRANLAEDHFSDLDAAAQAGHEQDLALLVGSYLGIAAIAKRYVEEPAFRERITRIVETLPADEQERFLGNVRRAMDEGATQQAAPGESA